MKKQKKINEGTGIKFIHTLELIFAVKKPIGGYG
jgi:hypothetical protein